MKGTRGHARLKKFYMDGNKTCGGYSSYSYVPSYFVINIPDAIPLLAAPPTYVII